MKDETRLSERERRELSRLDREAARPKTARYLLFVMIVLTVIYVVDEITSNVNAAIPNLFSLILFGGIVVKDTKDFFADYDHALSKGKAE